MATDARARAHPFGEGSGRCAVAHRGDLSVKVLITGSAGQLGRSLLKTAPADMEIKATDVEPDIRDPAALQKTLRSFKPAVIVNAAAYTVVDRAESERDLAFAVNAAGVENLARAARDCGARLIHVSTDFVFDGTKSSPYLPTDPMRPLNVYGESKAEGEKRLRAVLGDKGVIVRSGWLYAAAGNNFVKTILRLLREKDSLGVIADQVGTPTWAGGLAEVLWKIVRDPRIAGTHHWSDAGVASWYDFAVAIQEEALAAGLLSRTIPIRPLATSEYPLPAKRPAYSVLDKRSMLAAIGMPPEHWRVNLRKMLKELAHA
ncbi:MAG: dTDP-4-dehydrorhamnose reductase [Gammaproteobacteria bacterium]|nr:dTDP-4-dehydrorhamnose reductase [Gammaproteobacteria bacterium]